MSVFRLGSFDIECSNLNADFGIILCMAVKEDGVDEPVVVRIDDSPNYKKEPWNDRWLCEQIHKVLGQFDLLVGWNSSKFDWPYINSRLAYWGLEPLKKKLHKDLIYTSRFQLALHSNRLASVQEFFELDTHKTSITGAYWVKALTGDRKAMDYIVDHCVKDVKVLEDVLARLKHLIKEIKV